MICTKAEAPCTKAEAPCTKAEAPCTKVVKTYYVFVVIGHGAYIDKEKKMHEIQEATKITMCNVKQVHIVTIECPMMNLC